MGDMYYHPEKYDLTTVGEIEWGYGDYSFDLSVVWKDDQGNFYYGEDHGCSCPYPFEDHTFEDLEKLSREEIQVQLNKLNAKNYGGRRDMDIVNLLGRMNG